MTDAAGPLNVTGAFVVDWFGTTSCVACTALIIYDYSITIDQEVQHIWKTRLNLTSVLFVITRYCSLLVVLGYVAFDLFPTSRSVSSEYYGSRLSDDHNLRLYSRVALGYGSLCLLLKHC
ncbi:hypothetical protein C8Q75DRAFT_423525 [Abortiporus biennis]|nr:hypothetical protein C8Q75DRAFT_423525 [Abortiporus biennis]